MLMHVLPVLVTFLIHGCADLLLQVFHWSRIVVQVCNMWSSCACVRRHLVTYNLFEHVRVVHVLLVSAMSVYVAVFALLCAFTA